MEKIVLIDGNSIFYRAFYALPLLKSEKGYSNAVYGFANILLKVIAQLKPTHIAVAFDVSKKTFRNDIFSEYKATRKPMPEELRSQIPILKEMLSKMNILVLEKQGLEGDDILGTIAHRFDLPVVIVTGDRDCFQLVDDTTTICRTLKGVTEVQMMDKQMIQTEYGLEPMQIVDMKALAGDSSDNIPGVAGVGEKTAVSLLQEYGSVEAIYDNIEKIKGKLKEKLEASKENAFMSKTLATINCNVDIACTLDDMKLQFPFGVGVREFFEEYQMRTFLKREDIWTKDAVGGVGKQPVCNTILVENIAQLEEKVLQCKKAQTFSVLFDEKAQEFHFSDGKEEFVCRAQNELGCALVEGQIFATFSAVLQDRNVLKIIFDTKAFLHKAVEFGVKIEKPYFDIALARHLLDGATVKNAEDVAFELGLSTETIAFSFVLAKNELLQRMQKAGVFELYQNLELPLVEVLFDMEQTGFKVDKDVFEALKKKYSAEMDEIKHLVTEMVGEFNLNSPKQLGEILFDKLGLPHNRKKSTGVEELEFVRDMHPVVPLILRYRKVNKFLSTYILGIEKHIDKNDLIHTTFKQTLTGTGRLSSTEPNLQNIPVRGNESKEIRSMYVAREKDHVLVDADYSQIELRLLAHLSGEDGLVESFLLGKDIHTETACKIFGIDPILVTNDMRRVAKIVNFGVIYGISDFGLANDLGISPKEAKKYIEDFYARNPKVEAYIKSVVEEARKTGEVRTMLGRVRKMVDISASNFMVRTRAERAAQNAPLQGAGADIIKLAMLGVANRLKKENLGAKLIMQVHDELIVDSPIEEADKVKELLKEEMENAFELCVPLSVEVSSSYRWE